jgi:hypothetical protein
MWRDAMNAMCDSCPFGHTAKQRHMRKSLRPGCFEEICQSVWLGGYFPCHKTTKFDDEGETIPHAGEKMCLGALEFVERAAKQRESSERRAQCADRIAAIVGKKL